MSWKATQGFQEKDGGKKSMTDYSHVQKGWWTIGNKRIYLKSKMEVRYALYLEFLLSKRIIKAWEYEPKTFWFEGIKRGCVSYKPDFMVEELSGKKWWAEVKGFMDGKSSTKLKRFSKYFPDEEIRVIDRKWFKQNHAKLSMMVPGW